MIAIHTLLCHAHMDSGKICLKSLIDRSADPLRLIIHDDGSLTKDDRGELQQMLPDTTFIDRLAADHIVERLLHPYPRSLAFRRNNILALKLFDLLLLNDRGEAASEADGDIRFIDSDIFFVKPFSALFAWPNEQTLSTFAENPYDSLCVRPWHHVGNNHVSLFSLFNSGIIQFRRAAVDIPFIEAFLGNDRISPLMSAWPFWAEQTVWNACAAHAGLCMLRSATSIRVANPRALRHPEEFIGLHFVSPTRKLLQPAMDSLARISVQNASPEPVRYIPATLLNPLTHAVHHLRNRIRSDESRS